MEGKKVKVPDEPSSEVCDLCGRPMVIKVASTASFWPAAASRSAGAQSGLVKDTGGAFCPSGGKGR